MNNAPQRNAARISAAFNLRTRPVYNYEPTRPKRDAIKEMIGTLTNYVSPPM